MVLISGTSTFKIELPKEVLIQLSIRHLLSKCVLVCRMQDPYTTEVDLRSQGQVMDQVNVDSEVVSVNAYGSQSFFVFVREMPFV